MKYEYDIVRNSGIIHIIHIGGLKRGRNGSYYMCKTLCNRIPKLKDSCGYRWNYRWPIDGPIFSGIYPVQNGICKKCEEIFIKMVNKKKTEITKLKKLNKNIKIGPNLDTMMQPKKAIDGSFVIDYPREARKDTLF